MKYLMKSGTLYDSGQEKRLACFSSGFLGTGKKVCAPDGALLSQTDVRIAADASAPPADVRSHEYVMLDAAGNPCMLARPDYAPGEDPSLTGWPVCRMPRVDRARLSFREKAYSLSMKDGRSYRLSDASGRVAVSISQRGLIGGWNITAADEFPPEAVCGIFAFCRYMEQENEFPMV